MSSLQNATIRTIDTHIGIDRLLTVLKKTAEQSNDDDAFYFENLYIYFSLLYFTKIDVEADSVDFRDQALKTLKILELKSNKFNQDVFAPLQFIINTNLNAMANVRKLG